jgi:hypothetical protein
MAEQSRSELEGVGGRGGRVEVAIYQQTFHVPRPAAAYRPPSALPVLVPAYLHRYIIGWDGGRAASGQAVTVVCYG